MQQLLLDVDTTNDRLPQLIFWVFSCTCECDEVLCAWLCIFAYTCTLEPAHRGVHALVCSFNVC